jgi:drug/metabolite transporter (DMT)-like permease
MYLTPPTTAILAWLIFNEPLTPLIILGTILTSLGVMLVNQPLPNFLTPRRDKELK